MSTLPKVESYAGQWNVQVVRGKVTTKCLWNACKALAIGLILMIIGTIMSTIGYYADHLSIGSEIHGNSTVKVRYENRGFHLNNLSYAGPIVMGIGGFIVVAACVMTFEARDSAAKIVPARLKPNTGNASLMVSSTKSTPRVASRPFPTTESRRSTSCQTPAGSSLNNSNKRALADAANRRALTAALAQFSLALNETAQFRKQTSEEPAIAKSPSAPDLTMKKQKRRRLQQHSSERNRYLITPSLPRQALSMDYDDKRAPSRESFEFDNGDLNGSRTSMVLDLHGCHVPVTIQVRDSSQILRDNSTRREFLTRQQALEEETKKMLPRSNTCCHRASRSKRLPADLHQPYNHPWQSRRSQSDLEPSPQHSPHCCRSPISNRSVITPRRSRKRRRQQNTDDRNRHRRCGAQWRSCSHEEWPPSGSQQASTTSRKNSRSSCPSPCRSRSLSPNSTPAPQRRSNAQDPSDG